MPTVDEILGPSGQKPTVDQILGPPPAPPVSTNALAFSGADSDEFFSQGSPGYLLDLFRQGVKDGWGARPLGLDPEADKWLKDNAPDYGILGRAFHDQIVRPTAAALDFLFNRAPNVIYHGIAEPYVQTGLVPRDVAALPEAFPAGHLTGLPVRITPLERAADLGVIGKGEAGYLGDITTAATEALTPTGRPSATERVVQPPSRETAPQPVEVVTPQSEAAVAGPDVHAIARQLSPDTFAEYDALAARKETLRGFLDDLAEQRDQGTSPAITALDRQIDEARARRLEAPAADRQAMANEITALEEQRAKLADELPKTGDTPEMAMIRRDLQTTDYRMRDLAPEVSSAYRRAGEGEEVPAPPPGEPVAAPTPPEATAAPETVPPTPAAPEAAPRAPLEGGIAGDVSRQLVAAGRPLEEADAAAALVQAHYETRAARFGGARGTAEDLYAADAPRITRARQRVPEMAQPEQLEQTRRGAIRLATEDARATIRLFKDADASTFIHETGHHWLDELVKDAADARAPADLLSDAKTVRDWLGVEEGAEIPRKAHEKFARGFERYMMEGHAPSAKLAEVFAKFRDWLTKIYETVTRLRSPINDDIRGVFDRMLATPNEKPVVAPERPTGTFADVHEADATHTPPAQAGDVAAMVRTERDRVAEAAHPEIENERLASRSPEAAGGGAAGGEVSGRSKPATGSDTGTAGRVQGSRPIGEGRGNATAESARASEIPAAPNDSFAPREDVTDKAGNIRLDLLNTPEDVNSVLRLAAAENNDFLNERRGVISDAEALRLADALGMSPEKLNRRAIGQAFSAEQIIAARKLLIQSATEVRDAMIKAATGSDADVLAYAKMKARHQMIQGQVAGVTAEAGRALRAFRAIEGGAEIKAIDEFIARATGRDLFQMREEAKLGASLDTPQKVSKFVRDSEKPKFMDMLVEFWINALLSGPQTHLTNIISNSLLALYSIPETAVSAGVGAVRQLLPGARPERVYLGEAGARAFGIVQGSAEGVRAGWELLKNEELTDLASKVEQRRFRAIPGRTGEVIRTPGRTLGAEDATFKGIGYRQELNALAYRQAMDEGLTGERFAARVAQLTTDPTEAMMERATENANYQTFNQKLERTGQAVQLFANSHPLIKFVIPFIRTPVNIVKYAAERSVAAPLFKKFRDNLTGKNGPIAQDQAIARVALGSAVSATAGYLAAQGLITGGGPSDPKKRATLYLTGWQPYSVKIGNMYYSYGRAEPLGTLLGVAADMFEVAHAATAEEDESVAKLVLASVAKNLTSKTWLKGPSDLIQAVTDSDRYGERYIQSLAGTVIPSAVAQYTGATDPYMREARTVLDAIKARVPGLSETLLPRRDIWGEPIERGQSVGPLGVTGIHESEIKTDPVNQALLRVGYFPAKADRKIRGVELTPQQYDDYTRIGGRLAKMQLDAMVTPAFALLPPDTQAKMMRETISHARELAATQVMMQSVGGENDIIQKAMDAKSAALHGASRPEIKERLKVH